MAIVVNGSIDRLKSIPTYSIFDYALKCVKKCSRTDKKKHAVFKIDDTIDMNKLL